MKAKVVEYEQGSETGYVTDSSVNDKQESEVQHESREERAYINRRKTKSERDKKRVSRASLIVTRNDSESETNDYTNQPKYRRRAGSKRNECDKENYDLRQPRGSRRGSSQLANFGSAVEDLNSYESNDDNNFKLRRQMRSPVNSFIPQNANKMDKSDEFQSNHLEESALIRDRVSKVNKPRKENTGLQHIHEGRSRKNKLQCVSNDNRDEFSDHKSRHERSRYGITESNISTTYDEERDQVSELKPKPCIQPLTATLKMNGKDIYCGTWDPKERAVFNQVIQNMDTKKSGKKKLTGNLMGKVNKKEDICYHDGKEKYPDQVKVMYPISEYMKPDEGRQKKSLFGFFTGIKKIKDILTRNDRNSNVFGSQYLFPRDPIIDYVTPKKKSFFRRFKRKKEVEVPRRRAHSTNSRYSVDCYLDGDRNLNASFTTLSSAKGSLFFKRTKSEDNLHGAFEYFANKKQVFHRTASGSRKSKSRTASNDNLTDVNDKSDSLRSHVFEPVQPINGQDAKEQSTFTEAKYIPPQKTTQHNINLQKGDSFIYKQYDSAFEEETRYFQEKPDACFSSVATSHPGFSYMSTGCPYPPKTPYSPHPRKSHASQGYTSHNNIHCGAASFVSDESAFGSYFDNNAQAEMSAIPHHVVIHQRNVSNVRETYDNYKNNAMREYYGKAIMI